MEYVFFLIGVLCGSIVTQMLSRHKTSYGYFSVEPGDELEEPGTYIVRISINKEQVMSGAKQIVLKQDNSQQ